MSTTAPKYISVLLKILFLGVLAVLGWSMFVLHRHQYEDFITLLMDSYGVPAKKEVFIHKYLTLERFKVLKWIGTLVFTGFLLFSIRIWKSINEWSMLKVWFARSFWSKWQQFLQSFFELPVAQKTMLVTTFVLLIAYRLIYLIQTPLLVDEVFSYLHFVSRGFVVSSVFYPGPNNHVFYNQICSIVGYFSNDPLLVMRMPIFIFGLATSIILFIIVKKHFNFWIALAAYLLYSFSPNVTMYSVLGRGYVLTVLFMLVFFISVVNIIREKDIKYYNIAFVLSASLGFYTMPSFFYPFCSIVFFSVFFGLFRKGIDVRWLIIDSLIVFIVINVLYLPVYLFNGPSAVFDNTWIRSLTLPWLAYFKALPGYFAEVNNWLWCVESGGIYISIIVFAISIFTLFKYLKLSTQFWLYMIISLSLIPVAIITIQHVLPYNRVWLYFTFFQYLYLAIAIYGVAQVVKQQFWQVAIIGVLTVLVGYWQSVLLEDDYKKSILASQSAADLSKELIAEEVRSIKIIPSGVTDVYYNYLKLTRMQSQKQLNLIYSHQGEGELVVYPKGVVKRSDKEAVLYDEFVEVYTK